VAAAAHIDIYVQTESPKHDREEERDAVREYLRDFSLDRCVAVTLTMKQGDAFGKLDSIKASQNLRHFLNRLNRQAFGKRFQRFDKRLRVFAVLENSVAQRLHYHLVLESAWNDARYTELVISESWQKTRFGHREIHVGHSVDATWIGYITKFKTAGDSIDWENCHKR
jgi:hypothetical protein